MAEEERETDKEFQDFGRVHFYMTEYLVHQDTNPRTPIPGSLLKPEDVITQVYLAIFKKV